MSKQKGVAMPTLEENRYVWDHDYDWFHGCDEWSAAWGGAEVQWYYTILPRIHTFIPTHTILEIAPGFGRWTQFLKDHCHHLTRVDLSEKCIEACKSRFATSSHISYHLNDGQSLEFVPDESIDFMFSFDSLVHAEDDVMNVYLEQLGRKLTNEGVAFIHHSNLGEYARYCALLQKFPSRVGRILAGIRLIETFEEQWRAASMSAMKFEQYARQANLQCIGQEKINWHSRRLVDCISVITRKKSSRTRPNKVVTNENFMREAQYAAKISSLYKEK
jgi:ubiquinone/menaquinone biosynthesis C-methylase UbiE